MKIWLNDRLVDSSRAVVSIFDHGFLYGDGVYETLRSYGGKCFLWPAHFRRFKQSASAIFLKLPMSADCMERAVAAVLKANRVMDATVRLTLSRGPGSLGLDPDLCPETTFAIMLHPVRDMETFWKTGITAAIVSPRKTPLETLDPLIKSTSLLSSVLAKRQAQKAGAQEGLFLNLQQELTEGTTTNLFFITGGILHTPALACGLLNGITRQTVMQLAIKNGISVEEGRYNVADLLSADECFITNSTFEVMPVVTVRRIDSLKTPRTHSIGKGHPGLLTRRLHELYRREVSRQLDLLLRRN